MPVFSVKIDDRVFEVEVPGVFSHHEPLIVKVNGQPIEIAVKDHHRTELPFTIINGRSYTTSHDRDLRWLESRHALHRVEVRDLQIAVAKPASGDGRVKAPIPGLISRIRVGVGETVETGQPLLTLEAMKMQNEIRAPFSGVVRALPVNEGQVVSRAQVLIEIE